MRTVIRAIAWVWIVVNALGEGFTALTFLGEPIKALVVLFTGAILISPGLLVLWLTRRAKPSPRKATHNGDTTEF